MPLHGLVFGFARGDFHRAGRTERSLTAAGVAVEGEPTLTPEALAIRLRAVSGPLLLARAGVWLADCAALTPFPPSATGRPLIGFGAVLSDQHWTREISRSGGDLQRRSWWTHALPEPGCIYFEAGVIPDVVAHLERGRPFRETMQRVLRDRRLRAVHLPALDAQYDSALRVLEVVTTIQIGGAERVTLDLAEELARQGVRVAVAAFGCPTRLAFPVPENFADLTAVPNTPEARAAAVAECARDFGADLVHAHLIRASEARAIKACGLPLAMTLHNMPAAWPAGLAESGGVSDLIFACSLAVEKAWSGKGVFTKHASRSLWQTVGVPSDEGAASLSPVPARTVWNGINPKSFSLTAEQCSAAAAWRAARGWCLEDFVVAAVANPRPQKRFHLLPEILRELQSLLPDRAVRLVLVGAHTQRNAEAQQAVAAIEAAIVRCGVARQVHWTGGTRDIVTLLAASDALVSTSAYEGLSLAHLEALASGLPVVATDVGGAAEIASPLLQLVPPESDAETFAVILAQLARSPAPRTPALPPSFTRYRMAARTRLLYPRVIERARARPGSGELWLITNNFSTGGAQSSARRLLLGLAERGMKVRAFTVQEEPEPPTAGRAALLRAGIPVVAIPQRLDAAEATARILEDAASAPPRAVLFWNLITSYKILLADGFIDTPIYDVSPGAMYFASLAKYFTQPRPGLPYLTPGDYGARLAGVVVKYAAEVETAAALGAPVHLIRNGIASYAAGATDHSPSGSRVRAGGPFIIGTAARLSPDKRLEDLLDALRLALPRLPPCELRIAGGVERDGENYARELRRRARGLPVRWCGELSGTADFLAGLDVFAMISEPAGCPNASLEALAAGRPVIATDVGGASEQVLDGVTGRLIPHGDASAFAEALIELAHDAETRARFATAGAAHVRTNFSLEQMIEHYSALCCGRLPESPVAVGTKSVMVASSPAMAF